MKMERIFSGMKLGENLNRIINENSLSINDFVNMGIEQKTMEYVTENFCMPCYSEFMKLLDILERFGVNSEDIETCVPSQNIPKNTEWDKDFRYHCILREAILLVYFIIDMKQGEYILDHCLHEDPARYSLVYRRYLNPNKEYKESSEDRPEEIVQEIEDIKENVFQLTNQAYQAEKYDWERVERIFNLYNEDPREWGVEIHPWDDWDDDDD